MLSSVLRSIQTIFELRACIRLVSMNNSMVIQECGFFDILDTFDIISV